MSYRLPRFGAISWTLLCVAWVLAILVALFDWNWLRHPAENYFIERSGRQVRIGDLDVSFNGNLEPTVRLRNVYVQNAPWADDRPFITAGEVAFTFALSSISERRPIVRVLQLVDADVDLERQADGHRNWRLRDPENVARGRMKVHKLVAENSRVRFIRRDNGFEVVAAASALQQPAQNPAGALTKRIRFRGKLNGVAFSGDAETGDFLTLMESEEMFPLRGHMESGKSRIDVDGSMAALFKPTRAEGEIQLKGPSLANLHPLLPGKLSHTRAYVLKGTVHQEADLVSLESLHARVGATVLTGGVSFDSRGERPLVKAHLRSESADPDDFGSFGDGEALAKATVPPLQKQEGPEDTQETRGRFFSPTPLHLERLDRLDAEFDLLLKRVRIASIPGVEGLHVQGGLKQGVLRMKPVIGFAEGRITGLVQIDGRQDPPLVEARLAGRDVRLEKLLAGRKLQGVAAGPLEARIDLTARGNSAAALAGSLSGSAEGGMQNGVISGVAAAALELNLGKVVKALISGNKPIGITRIETSFDFEHGKGSARVFFVDTEQTKVVGTGDVDLRKEALDLILTPHPKKKTLFALDSAIRVHGAMRDPKIDLQKQQHAMREE